ncbi:polyadenylate-binding protein 8-like [Iris pallida]|uniref:Polyadenylate-binding protein 8-like n=1 Tax=Iris pallida TaxID=29817 RepID=A0AAX6IJ21_IRIPA|nr:polyadenylate-binding protein 8-like [Iris pallida]
MREGDGKSKCFGFVNFVKPEDAARVVEELNGKKFDDKEWYVGKAQKKSKRESELKGRFDQSAKEVAEKYQGVNLYLKNLDDSIGDDKLRELFSEFGTITSCKVMRDVNGISRGSGFVAFSSPQDAARALGEMNGKKIGSKPLYVAIAQRKEDRRARLHAQFFQMRPVAIPANIAPRMPVYPHGAPGLGQQLFYGQASLLYSFVRSNLDPAALVPGMRPDGAPMANFSCQWSSRVSNHRDQGEECWVDLYSRIKPCANASAADDSRGGRVYRYPPGRNMPDVPMPGLAGGMLSVSYDMGGMPMRDAGMSQPIPIGALTLALANASPEQQRTMLGESLYPLVDQLEHESAVKVTGMLLEMDQTEVLHLLESPDALKAKVAEAMDVLRNVAQQPGTPTDQLSSLSLNDGIVS